MRVRDCMESGGITTVQGTDDLKLAAQILLWHGARHLPVLRDGRVIGVLSERDLLARQAALGKRAAGRMSVAEAMSTPALVAGADEDLAVAAERMLENRVGCLPVLERGTLVGMLTRSDLLRAIAEAPEPPLAGPTDERLVALAQVHLPPPHHAP